jgi:large subunit ribosomal protein L3
MSETATTEKPAAVTLKAILGQKVGMTQIFDSHGHAVPVTVVQAGPCHVTQVLTRQKHGYAAIQVAFGEKRQKSVNKPDAGQFKKAAVQPLRWLREFRTEKSEGMQPGQAIRVDVFSAGDYVDVWGISKGKGFAGAMKRHNFRGGPATHGQSDRQRAPGSSGSNTYPGRVFKGKRFPGHMGVQRTTVQHVEVVQVVADKDLMMIRGALPGSRESLVVIEETVKRVKHYVERRVAVAKKEKAAKKEPAKAPAKAPAAAAAAAKPKAAK